MTREKKLTIAIVAAIAGIQATVFALGLARVVAQGLPTPEDAQHSVSREAMRGLLSNQTSIPEIAARQRCLVLPVDVPEDRLQSPHREFLIGTNCEVIADQPLDGHLPAGWITSRYRWTSVFTAEDTARGPDARDTVIEEEVVFFEPSEPGEVRANLARPL
jgi:hypothetical protein